MFQIEITAWTKVQKSAHMRCVLGRWESPAEQKHKVHLNRDEAGEVKRAEIDGWLIYVEAQFDKQ